MAPTANVTANPTSHNVASLLPKLQDPDPDIRYMTLNDLHQILSAGSQTFLLHDYTTCAKVVEGLLHTLADTHGDVQNMAIQCLGPFVNKAPESILCPTIEKVSNIATAGSLDNSIPALAVRAIVVALPQPVVGVPKTQRVLDSYNAVSRALIPRLVGRIVVPLPSKKLPDPPKGMLQQEAETGVDSNSLDLLAEVARCFGSMLVEAEVSALNGAIMSIFESAKSGSVMKKKAVIALSALAPYFNDNILAHNVTTTIEKLRSSHLVSQQRKLYFTVFGSLARAIPQKFGPYLKTLCPFVLSPLSESELVQQREAEADADGERDIQLEEVREAALSAIESFLQSCAVDMQMYNKDVIDASTRFLKYEPNLADGEDEDMDEEAEEEDEQEDMFDGEEDFEEETGFEDEDDVSWKVRRCSAKALHALLTTLDPNDPATYTKIAPALISRFKEKEESVRTEVLATLAHLVVRTGSNTTSGRQIEQPMISISRKRRRGFSDSLGSDIQARRAVVNGYASPSTPPPADSAMQSLAQINPEIIKASAKLLKTSTLPTKQVTLSLIKDLVEAQHGGLSASIDLVIDPVIETMETAKSSGSNLANNNIRIEALALLQSIARTHSSKVISPHLSKIIPVLVSAAKDRYAKLASEAFITIEFYIKAVTPPRSAGSKTETEHHLSQLYAMIVERISAGDTDTEVRQRSIQTLGLIIGRTAGSTGVQLLNQQNRFSGQQLIVDRMKNELLRLSCIRAVDDIIILAQSKNDFQPGFVGEIAIELATQLRKSSRSLRGASLSALRMLAINQASRECLSEQIIEQLVEMLIPLLKTQDLHMMGPALVVLAAFAKDRPALVATAPVIDGICDIVTSSVSGPTLDSLLTCVETIGQSGSGKALMTALLKVGVQGDTEVTGQVIGTLLVAGGDGVGVDLSAFVKELQTQSEESNRCLALSILGEGGLRMGAKCPLKPETFTPYFADDSEKVKLAAAVALGRAGAGNVTTYLPRIINDLTQSGGQYLLLHSVKEILQHSNAEEEIKPYTERLWQNVISSGQNEDNKVVGAECLGRFAIIDPSAYLRQLHTLLQNESAPVRGMAISAFRYVFADTDVSYNQYLQGGIASMLEVMLGDPDLDNQRLSLSTFNSALHNKADLVIPCLPQLLPFAMQASVPRPELIREVSMGPFKHKIDDGLEMRKSAYETLYALLDSPASRQRLDLNGAFYDRIVAGISDEHEIKILCCLVLTRLISLTPQESTRRLESLAQQFRAVLSVRPKENAVKQELEKLSEQSKAVVKVSVALNKSLAAPDNRAWKDYFDWVRKDFSAIVKQAEDELKDGAER